jgi:hypothetical protein
MARPEYAQYSRRALTQALEGATLVPVGPNGPELGEDAIPGREGRLAGSFADHTDQRGSAVAGLPGVRPSNRIAVRIGAGDQDECGVWQAIAWFSEPICFAGWFGRMRTLLGGFGHSPADQIAVWRRPDDA